jgi:hypothetical protein
MSGRTDLPPEGIVFSISDSHHIGATFWCNHSMTDIYSEEEQLLACQQSKS